MISVAIPTYNRSAYLWDCIKSFIDSDFIGEIIISDDGSNDNQYYSMCNIVSKLKTDKIKIFRNHKNQGAFVNKYISVSKCSFDWVYLFDSDNWIDRGILQIIENIDYSKKDTCFAEEKLFATDGNIVNFSYEDKIIDLNIAKKYIKNKVFRFDWFLNNGNFIVNKEQYLNTQKDFFESKIYHGTIDVFLFSYYWFKYKNKYEIVDGLYHHHRIHESSYFMENYEENMKLVQEYFDKILNL